MSVNYNKQARLWRRNTPQHRSDFCGRPEVFEIFKALGRGKIVLDLGCGEGYFSRKISKIAKKVVGIDSSEAMIELTRKSCPKNNTYVVGDVKNMSIFKDSTFNLCIGNYITNYLKVAELPKFYKEIARVSKSGGKFILLMPHPIFELVTDFGEAVRYKKSGYDYLDSRDKFYAGKIKTITNITLPVGLYHTTLFDHFNALLNAGLRIIKIKEPVFSYAIARKYPLFKKMAGKVACLIIVGKKT